LAKDDIRAPRVRQAIGVSQGRSDDDIVQSISIEVAEFADRVTCPFTCLDTGNLKSIRAVKRGNDYVRLECAATAEHHIRLACRSGKRGTDDDVGMTVAVNVAKVTR
jgi:hypothetical protein